MPVRAVRSWPDNPAVLLWPLTPLWTAPKAPLELVNSFPMSMCWAAVIYPPCPHYEEHRRVERWLSSRAGGINCALMVSGTPAGAESRLYHIHKEGMTFNQSRAIHNTAVTGKPYITISSRFYFVIQLSNYLSLLTKYSDCGASQSIQTLWMLLRKSLLQ